MISWSTRTCAPAATAWAAACCCLLLTTPPLLAADGAEPSPHASAPASAPAGRPFSLGLLPVSAGDERSAQLRGAVESALDVAAARLPNVDVLDRTRIDKVLKELTFSKLGRQDLQAGEIVGAEVLLVASLSTSDREQTLELAALETATGNVLLNRKSSVADEAAEIFRWPATTPGDNLADTMGIQSVGALLRPPFLLSWQEQHSKGGHFMRAIFSYLTAV